MVISPRVRSSKDTDFSSLAALFASPRFEGKSGQDLAIALWELIVDKREGLYHSCPPIERLTDHFVWDPLKLLNCFGWSICGLTANTMAVLCLAAGFADARIANLKGHEAAEVFYDGAWHLLDGDLQAFHRRHPPHQGAIASCEECIADPTLVSRQSNPSSPYYLPDRPPEKMAELYRVEPSAQRAFAEHAHTMDFVLRPGERFERNTFHEAKWVWFSNYNDFKARWPGEWRDDGPWERFPPHRRFGNGKWVYEPLLTSDFRDFEVGVLNADGLEPDERGVVAARGGTCWCVFEFNSPYVFTGTPARDGSEAPRNGAIVEATLVAGERSAARIEVAVEPHLPWLTVWESPASGRHDVRLDLTEHVANSYRYLVRISFAAARAGACALERLRVTSSIMVAPGSLGSLREGVNELTVRFGDERGLPTRRWMVETNFRDEADLRRNAHRVANLRFDPGGPDRILPANPRRDYEIVFKLDAPPHGRLQRVYAFGSYRGKAPDDRADRRVAAYVAEAEDGPWQPLFESPVLVDRNRWHFSEQGEAALDELPKSAFVRFVGRVGMNAARIRAHYLDDRVGAIAVPLVVTHVWDEADGSHNHHAELVGSASVPHDYAFECGPGPELRSVVMQLGSAPE